MTTAGEQRVLWDGRDDQGRIAGSGVYMVRVRAQDRATTAKMMLIRQRR
jgi:flagellar hook assembly protein FlgD